MGFILFIGLIALLLLAVAAGNYFFREAEKKRRLQWAEFAQSKGWHYSIKDPGGVAGSFKFLDQLGRGKDRYAQDVFGGFWESLGFYAFSYHYATTRRDSKGRRRTTHHWFSVVSVHHGHDQVLFPELKIGKENALKRLGHMVTGNDIDFESIEFSRQFEVKSADKKFAYDFCDSSMMEYLLAETPPAMEIEGQWISIVKADRLELEDMEPQLALLSGVRRRIPEHIFRS